MLSVQIELGVLTQNGTNAKDEGRQKVYYDNMMEHALPHERAAQAEVEQSWNISQYEHAVDAEAAPMMLVRPTFTFELLFKSHC